MGEAVRAEDGPADGMAGQVRRFFEGAHPAHDWGHVERVRRTALRLAKAEGADGEVVELAALWHDVGRQEEAQTGEDHAAIAARRAGQALAGHPKREAVVAAILGHRFRGGLPPESVEARVLYDADKLDAIGAIGVGRAFAAGTEHGETLEQAEREYHFKLKRIRFHTESGRRLARERQRVMRMFFERFRRELEGGA